MHILLYMDDSVCCVYVRLGPNKNTKLSKERTVYALASGAMTMRQQHYKLNRSWAHNAHKRIPKPKTKKAGPGWLHLATLRSLSITMTMGYCRTIRTVESDLINAQRLCAPLLQLAIFSCSICCTSWRALWFRYDHKKKLFVLLPTEQQ